MEQQQIKLLSFRAENHRIIKCIALTPDLLSQRLIQVTGNIGEGKSSLLEMLQTALSGSDAIKKKEALEKGYLAEVQLMDGDIKLYAGAKVTEFQRGEKAGEPKFEIFLYSKDESGKPYVPVIGGHKVTAGDYTKMLTTELTFSMPMLFTANQTDHRKLLEKLFAEELNKLDVEKIVREIEQAKRIRDNKRALCDANGAFMETFRDEGWKKEDLELLKPIDMEALNSQILELQVNRGSLIKNVEQANELAKTKAQQAKDTTLSGIKERAQVNAEAIREITNRKVAAYDKALADYKASVASRDEGFEYLSNAKHALDICNFIPEATVNEIKERLCNKFSEWEKSLDIGELPTVPVLVGFSSDGKPNIDWKKEDYDSEYGELLKERSYLLALYQEVYDRELEYKKQDAGNIDTSEFDKKIEQLTVRKSGAEVNNKIYNRYMLWKDWIEAKAIYEARVDELRRLYASISTGVPGMHIVPTETKNGNVEIWMKYNAEYDPEFFGNPEKEMRYLFDYSASQRGVIGVILQAARLDLKPKALRLCILDDIPFTNKGISVLTRLCEDRNIQLITSRTDDRYDKDKLTDSEIIIEGGECFFNLK